MTGWRLGYGIFPKDLAPAIARLMTNSNSCTAAFTQLAGIAALTGSQRPSEEMVEEFRRRRDFIVRGLNEIPGLTCQMPKGAFYAFPNITGTGLSSREVADLLLYEGGVAALAGTAFGAFGEGYIRLSYANSIANIERALARIKTTLAAQRQPAKGAAVSPNGARAPKRANGTGARRSAKGRSSAQAATPTGGA
jgi:aspartate/methionine/tyrosine aminotransferase